MIIIDFWPYDLIISGSLDLESEITDHPIEDGSEVTDNATRKPIAFKLETLVSDTPIGEIAEHDSRRIDEVSIAVFGSDQIPLPSSEAYERLTAIWTESRAVQIEIPFASRTGKPGKRTFKNMMIERLSMPMGSETDGGLKFEVDFKQAVIVQNRRVLVRTAVPRGAPRQQKSATVGQALRIDNQVTWRMAYPPGSAYDETHGGWSVVNVTWSDGKGGPGATTTFTWDAVSSLGQPGRVSFNLNYAYAPGTKLNAIAAAAFHRDLIRDGDAKKKAWQKVNGSDGPGAVYNARPADTMPNGMPAGYSPGRFSPANNPVPTMGPLHDASTDIPIHKVP